MWNHFPFGRSKRIRVALSQVAGNVFYLFNGRRILSPQTQSTHSSVTAAQGGFHQWGCEIHPQMSIHLQPCGIWGFCCRARSEQRLQPRPVCCWLWMSAPSGAGEGWASLGFQLPTAPQSLWAVTARGGQGSATGHSLGGFVLSESKANGTRARVSRRKDPVDTILQRLLPAFYVCPLRCLFELPCY